MLNEEAIAWINKKQQCVAMFMLQPYRFEAAGPHQRYAKEAYTEVWNLTDLTDNSIS